MSNDNGDTRQPQPAPLDYRAPIDDINDNDPFEWLGIPWVPACCLGTLCALLLFFGFGILMIPFLPILAVWHVRVRMKQDVGLGRVIKEIRFYLAVICILVWTVFLLMFPDYFSRWQNYGFKFRWLVRDPFFRVYLIPIGVTCVFAFIDAIAQVQRIAHRRKQKYKNFHPILPSKSFLHALLINQTRITSSNSERQSHLR